MPKILFVPPPSRPLGLRKAVTPAPGGADVRHLHGKMDDVRSLVDCTQRSVARGRSRVVDAHCRIVKVTDPPADLRQLSQRIDESHRRLLAFSAEVEMELDRLEVTCLEIERVTSRRPRRGSR